MTATAYQPSESLEIFPNPSRDYIIVRLPDSGSTLEIFDASGRKMFSTIDNESNVEVDVRDFPAGVYFLKANDGSKLLMRKFIKAVH